MKKQLQRKFINIILAITFIFVLIPAAPKISAEDITVRVLVEPSLEYAVEPFSEGLASVGKDGKYGYINKTGKVVIPLEFDRATSFSEGLASVKKDGKYGYIDKTGKVVIPFETYSNAGSFNEGLAAVKSYGLNKWGFIDKTGNLVISFEYDSVIAPHFSEGLARVSKDGKSGLIDKTGNMVLEYSGDLFSDGLASVKKDDKYGFIDKTGKVIVPFEYGNAFPFIEGLALVYNDKEGKSGFIDKTGNMIIPFDGYLSDYVFSEGLVFIYSVEDEKYGYIDKTGKVVVPFEYEDSYVSFFTQDALGSFREGLAWVKKDNKYGILEIVGSQQSPANLAVVPSSQKVFLNNKEIQFNAYNINGNNYFKLRDLAYVFNSTNKQFDVGWDDANRAISLTSSKAYTAIGGEMTNERNNNPAVVAATVKIYLDNKELSLTAYNIDGNNYFKLRDIMKALNVFVGYDDSMKTITLDTSKGYVD